MKFFDSFYAATSRGTFRFLDYLLNSVLSLHWAWFLVAACAGIMALFVGRRLSRFNHPDLPILSPTVRVFAGRPLFWAGTLATAGCVLLPVLTVGLVWVGSMSQAALQRVDQWTLCQSYLLRIWPWVQPAAYAAIGGAVAGLVFAAFLTMWTIPSFERGQGLRDVRYMQRLFSGVRMYSPQQHIDLNKGVFVGLEDGKHPVHVPLHQFHETHTQILGASGSGKGIALGLLSYQFVIAGECLIFIDPKGDKRIPVVLAQAAKMARVAFHHLDLNPDAAPQFNLLAGIKAHEIEEILVGGLGLQPSEGDSDYYRGIDQDAAEEVARRVASVTNPSLLSMLEIAQKDASILKAENFVRRLRQVCSLPAIQSTHNFDFDRIVERGDVLYIRGSTDNHRVKSLQTMLLIRILQVVKSNATGRKMALVLDEFKHVLCQVSLDALGVVREMGSGGCHALLAHQSMGDLGACAGLRREDVEPRVVDNTTLKLLYRINDAKASADFAARSGKQRTFVEGVRNLDEDRQDQRGWTEAQHFRMSEDLFTHLHRPSDGKEVVAAGVLFGFKAARLLAVSPIRVNGSIPPVKPAPEDTIEKMPAVGGALI